MALRNSTSAKPRRSDAIERACRNKGLRMTGQRRIIAQVLDAAEDHPDVVELHRRAAEVDDRISLSTVYRTVKLFETEGILERLDFRGWQSMCRQIDGTRGQTVEFWTLANYRAFFTQGGGVFLEALWNSIEVTLTVTGLSVLVAYPIAYVLAYRVPARWQRLWDRIGS